LGSLNTLVLVSIAITVLAIISPVTFGQNDSTVDLEKIEALFDEEKYEGALSYLGDILRKHPNDEVALINKGHALYYLEREQEAIEYYDKALKINPENDEALYFKTKALHALERYEEALTNAFKSLEINPENDEALQDIGLLLFLLGNYEESITYFDKVLEINSTRADALEWKANVLSELGSKEESLIFYDKSLRIEPNNTQALNNMGYTLLELERYEEALEYFDRALEVDPKYNTAFYNRGDALKSLGINELGSTVFPNEIRKGVIYETFGPIIKNTPLVCAVEFESELLTKNDVDRIMKETGTAVSEWEVQLKNAERIRDKKPFWEIDYTVVPIDESSVYDYSKCDVTIRFMDIPEDPDLQLFAYGMIKPNKLNKEQANIEIYLTKLSISTTYLEKVGDIQYYTNLPSYSDRARATDVIATTVRHEFGHALGLGHYYSENPQETANWSDGRSPAPSVMVKFSLDNENLQRILPVDIEMIRSTYGENGFLANLKVPQVETPSSAFEKIKVEEIEIPDWIRNNAEWWAQGAIGDSDFVSGIQYLIKEGIIQIPETAQPTTGEVSEEIPSWIKNNAEWWSQGLISDDDFVKGLQYLVEQGVIQV